MSKNSKKLACDKNLEIYLNPRMSELLSSINETIKEIIEHMNDYEHLVCFLRKIREAAPQIVSIAQQKGVEKESIEEYLENIFYAMYAFQVLVYQDTQLGTVVESTDVDNKLMIYQVLFKVSSSEKIFRIGVKNYYNQGQNNPQAHLGRIYWEAIDLIGNLRVCNMQIRGDVTGSHAMILDMAGRNAEYQDIEYQNPLNLSSRDYHFPLGQRANPSSLRLENERIAGLLRNYTFYSKYTR